MSSKLGLLENLIPRTDYLIIGGAMANTFFKARGLETGKSLVEDDFVEKAAQLLAAGDKKGVKMLLPVDVVVAPNETAGEQARQVPVESSPRICAFWTSATGQSKPSRRP